MASARGEKPVTSQWWFWPALFLPFINALPLLCMGLKAKQNSWQTRGVVYAFLGLSPWAFTGLPANTTMLTYYGFSLILCFVAYVAAIVDTLRLRKQFEAQSRLGEDAWRAPPPPPPQGSLRNLFVSYVEEDQSVVARIVSALENDGYRCWYYGRNSLPGIPFLRQAREAIEGAGIVVLVLSPQSLASHQVSKEIFHAHELDKTFIPVLVGLNHNELRVRQPDWAMVLGPSVSVAVPPDGVDQVAPRLLMALRSMETMQSSPASKGPEFGHGQPAAGPTG